MVNQSVNVGYSIIHYFELELVVNVVEQYLQFTRNPVFVLFLDNYV